MLKVKQLGIGLLELMLSLAIIAILLIMATRYYQTTKQSQEVNDAVNTVNSIVAAMTNWMTDNPSSFTGSVVTVKFSDLVKDGYLPSSLGDDGSNASPWGTSISDPTFSATGAAVNVQINNVPKGACNQLAGRMAASCKNDADSVCGCADGKTYKGNFGTQAK